MKRGLHENVSVSPLAMAARIGSFSFACWIFFTGPDLRADRFVSGQAADGVVGQLNFTTNAPGSGDRQFNLPWGVAIDPTTGKFFVADHFNHRVLRFSTVNSAFSGEGAEAVLGQVDFNAILANQGAGPTARSIENPAGIHVDTRGRLWVADSDNHRVLCWVGASAAPTNTPADLVYGQPDFATKTAGTSASKMNSPYGVFCDGGDRLWVSERSNDRVLRFDNISHKASGAGADGVLGQSAFGLNGSSNADRGMNTPEGIQVDEAGRLWVADSYNHRILRFDNAATKLNGAAADGLLGQADFGTEDSATTATGMRYPTGVVITTDGTLWVADSENYRVIGFRRAATKAKGAAADLVLGQRDFITRDPTVTASTLFYPYTLGAGLSGSLIVSDSSSYRVVRFSPIKSPVVRSINAPRSTSAATATVRGSSSGPVSKVTYRVGNRGPFKTAKGTTNWSFKAQLKPGKNLVTVIAQGPGGTSVPKTVSITRK